MEDSTELKMNMSDDVTVESVDSGEESISEMEPTTLTDFVGAALLQQVYYLDAVTDSREKLFLKERVEDAAERAYCGLAKKQQIQIETSHQLQGINMIIVEEEESIRNNIGKINCAFFVVIICTISFFFSLVFLL